MEGPPRANDEKENSPPTESTMETVIEAILASEEVQALFRKSLTVEGYDERKVLFDTLLDIMKKTDGFVRLSEGEEGEQRGIEALLYFAFFKYRVVYDQEQLPIPRDKEELVAVYERYEAREVERIRKEIKDIPLKNLPHGFSYEDFTSDALTQSEIAEGFSVLGRGDLIYNFFRYFEEYPDKARHLGEETTPSAALIEKVKGDNEFVKSIIHNYGGMFSDRQWYRTFVLALIPHSVPVAETFIDLSSFSLESKEWLGEGYDQARRLLGRVHAEARERGRRIVEEGGGFTLSERDFKENFPSAEEEGMGLEQANVGNCGVVSSIEALRRWSHFELVCRSSVTKNSDGSWTVLMPLMNKEGKSVTITEKDLEIDDWGKHPVGGGKGYQVLEAAYIKGIFGKVYRKGTSGTTMEDLFTFLDPDAFTMLQFTVGETSDVFEAFLSIFDPDIHLAIINTTKDTKGVSVIQRVGPNRLRSGQEELLPSHAYTISRVNRDEEKIFIINPHDTSRDLEVTFEQCKEGFSQIEMARINYNTLIQRIEDLEERSKE